MEITDTLGPFLQKLARDVAAPREILRAGMTEMMAIAMEGFTNPSMRAMPWAPLAASTIRSKQRAIAEHRGRTLAILQLTQTMLRGFFIETVTNTEAVGANSQPYALFHQLLIGNCFFGVAGDWGWGLISNPSWLLG